MTNDSTSGPETNDRDGRTPGAGSTTYADRVLGCLLGTMAGDAYGLLSAAGDDPLAALEDPEDVAVSEATHLTLYTVDGLTEALEWANDGVAADETACLWLAYLRWLGRQGEHLPPRAPAAPARWLDRQEAILPVPDADPDTVRALLTGEMGTQFRPLNPLSQGPGALLRSAPFGLVPRIPASMVERLTTDAAALTHGSPAAKGTAALYSGIIRAVAIEGSGLEEAVSMERREEDHLAAVGRRDGAHRSPGGSADDVPSEPGTVEAGTTAAGTTAAGTFEAALEAAREGVATSESPREQFAAALAHAAAAGRSDASGVIACSVAGGILGALHGTSALPPAYLSAPGVADVVRKMAGTLLTATTGS